MEVLALECFLHHTAHVGFGLQLADDVCCDELALEVRIQVLAGFMEDVAEVALVHLLVVAVVGFLHAHDLLIEEEQLTAQIVVDGCRREEVLLQDAVEIFPAFFYLLHALTTAGSARGDVAERNLLVALHHKLTHETAHLVG